MRFFALLAALVAVLFQPYSHAQTKFVKSFDSLSALLLANPNDIHNVAIIRWEGASENSDEGTIFTYYPLSSAATNGTTIFKPVLFGGRWIRINGPGSGGGGGGGDSISVNGTAVADAAGANFIDSSQVVFGLNVGASPDAITAFPTNIADAQIVAGAAINATKIANGTVSSTEFQFIGGLTSDAQTQINSKGTGTVTSVGLTMPNQFAVSGTPVTGAGAFGVSLTNSTGAGAIALQTSPFLTNAALSTPSLTNPTMVGKWTHANLPTNGAAVGQVLKFDGITYTNGADATGGGGAIYVNGAPITDANFTNSATANFSVTSTTNVAVTPTNLVNSQISASASIDKTKIATAGVWPTAGLGSGTADDNALLRGDSTWTRSTVNGEVMRQSAGAASWGAIDLANGAAVSGVLADGNLSANVALLNGTNTWPATQTFSVIPVVPNDSFALGAKTTGNYVSDVVGTANEVAVSHTPSEGSTATLSLPSVVDLTTHTLKIPNGAAPSPGTFGELAGDNNLWGASHGAFGTFDGTSVVWFPGALASSVPTNGQTLKFNTGGTFTWQNDNTGTGAALDGTNHWTGTNSFDLAVTADRFIATNGFYNIGGTAGGETFYDNDASASWRIGANATMGTNANMTFPANPDSGIPYFVLSAGTNVPMSILQHPGVANSYLSSASSSLYSWVVPNGTGPLVGSSGATLTNATILGATNWSNLILSVPTNTNPGFKLNAGVVAAAQRNWGVGLNYTTTGDFVIRESSTNTTDPFVASGTTRFELLSGGGAVVSGAVTAGSFSGSGGGLTLNASGFDGNLTTSDDTLQEVAQKLDDLSVGGTPGGANGDVQYKNGSSLGAEAAFHYDSTTNWLFADNLSVTTNLYILGGTNATWKLWDGDASQYVVMGAPPNVLTNYAVYWPDQPQLNKFLVGVDTGTTNGDGATIIQLVWTNAPAGTAGTVINTGTPIVSQVPRYTDTTGTNIAPSTMTVAALGGMVITNSDTTNVSFNIKGPSGGTNDLIAVSAGGTNYVKINSKGQILGVDGVSVNPTFAFANAIDTGMKWRNPGLSWEIVGVEKLILSASALTALVNIDINASATPYLSILSDTYIVRDAVNVWQLGLDAATPSAQTLHGPDGSGTDKAGGDVTLYGGRGTGTNKSGAFIVSSGNTTTTGSTLHTVGERLHIADKFVNLTAASDTLFCTITNIGSGKYCSVKIYASINADDGTDFQSLAADVNFSIVNKAGTVTPSTVIQVVHTTAASSGTITSPTFTAVASGNGVDVKCNTASSLTETTLRIKYMLWLNSNDAATVIEIQN